MILHAIYTVDEVHIAIAAAKKSRYGNLADGTRFKASSHRLQLFFSKGSNCIYCQAVGAFYALESSVDETPHLNLYALNAKGVTVLMTKDHIHPHSLGGADTLENYQPMCQPCNSFKGHKLESELKRQHSDSKQA